MSKNVIVSDIFSLITLSGQSKADPLIAASEGFVEALAVWNDLCKRESNAAALRPGLA
jgi:hypothetical protein